MTFPMPVFSPVVATGPTGNDANTVVLLHCDGSDGSTTITNSAVGGSTTFTAAGDAQIDTAQSKFGGAALQFDGTGDSVTFDASVADFTWAGEFAFDLWVRSTSSALEGGAQRRIFAFGTGATNLALFIDNSPAGVLTVLTGNGTVLITGTTNISDSTWRHIAVTRDASDDMRLFVDGTQEGSTVSNATTWVGAATAFLGRFPGSAIGHYVGHMDEIRMSKDAVRWDANFTPPTSAYS